MDLQRQITSYHEAAHAVMAFRLGLPVDFVKVCATGPLFGYVQFSRAALISAVVARRASIASWPLVVRDTEHRAMMLLAGPLAEARLLGTPLRAYCCESDLRRCELLCTALLAYAAARGSHLRDADGAAMANRLRRRTARILGRPDVWHVVTALAAELAAWGSLSGDDAADSVQWTRRIRNQLDLLLPMPKRSPRQPATVARRGARPAITELPVRSAFAPAWA